MSDTRSSWVQVGIAGLVVVGAIIGVWLSMSTESAVHGEQIRRIKEDAYRLESSFQKCADGLAEEDRHNAEHIRLAERGIDGLVPVVKAIKEIADSNALKLDALLHRDRIANTRLVSTDGR